VGWSLWKPYRCVYYSTKLHLFSLTRVYFNSVYCPGKYATRFGLYSDHTQACQYKNLTKLLIQCVPTFSIACRHKTVSSDIGYRVTAVSTSRSCLNLWPPRFLFGGGNRKSLGNEFPLHNHSHSRLFSYETVRQVDLFPERFRTVK